MLEFTVRLNGQPISAELARISLKYTSRISDLRAAGYDVECQAHTLVGR